MPDINKFIARHRNSRSVYFALWGAIALGIVPAIVAQNIIPVDSFALHFGVEITEFVYLPRFVCLLVFVAGIGACILQKRILTIALLLPWLALSWYDVGELTFKLPTYSAAQEELRKNYNLSKESENPPTIDNVRENLDNIAYPEIELISFDVEELRRELDDISTKLGIPNPGQKAKVKKTKDGTRHLSSNIRQAERQIKKIKKAIKDTKWISHLSLGLSDKHLENKLENGLIRVITQRKKWISQRNANRSYLATLAQSISQLAKTYNRLQDLDAEIKTYLWASQSYQAWHVSLAYSSICFLVLLVLIWQFSPGSWISLFTLSASLVVSLLYVEAPLVYRLWAVITFIIVSLIIRVAYQVWRENGPLIRSQSKAFLFRTMKTSLIYYMPFIILIFGGFYVSWEINNRIDDQLRALDILPKPELTDRTRRYYIDRKIDSHFGTLEKNIHTALNASAASGKIAARSFKGDIKAFYSANIPASLGSSFEAKPCKRIDQWVFKTGACIQKSVKHSLNQGYTSIRDNQLDALQQSGGSQVVRTNKDLQKAIAIAKEDVSESVLTIRILFKKQLGHLYSAIDFYSWLTLLVLILVTLKSFMYVFSRIFFAAEPGDAGRAIQFEMNSQPVQHGSVREISDKLQLNPDMGEQMFVNKSLDFANAPPDEVTPQAHKALFSRFINGVWHMNKIEMAQRENPNDAPYRRIPDDERIVSWTLKPGDSVIFSWKSFVGMSDAINIRTQYSWQLSSLVFGRMFFVVASVSTDSPTDGTLLLAARGSDGIDKSDNPSNSPDQLLAWQTTTRFQLHANLTFRNIYRSGIQIKALDSDLAVMQLNQRKRKSGAAAFLKYFLIPV